MNALTYSAAVEFENRKAARDFRRMVKPQTKPDNLKYPKRKRAWRIVKKWFNRFERPAVRLGRYQVEIHAKDGSVIRGIITDVRIAKSTFGRHKQDRNYTIKPLTI